MTPEEITQQEKELAALIEQLELTLWGKIGNTGEM